MSALAATVWDFDGTLVDSRARNLRVNRRLEESGRDLRIVTVHARFGGKAPEAGDWPFPPHHQASSPEEVVALARRIREE